MQKSKVVAVVCIAAAVLFAGCAIERLQGQGVGARLNDQATMALLAWREAAREIVRGASLADMLAEMHGGRNLVRAGLRADIDYCATLDRIDAVPRLDLDAWSIRIP
jgi:phosphosulfolactate phosphohydrolase-like enzyme